jgi:transcriptional regulator with XRE-family HTH domain
MAHYTAANDRAFVNRIMFDFMAQLEERLAVTDTTQSQLAKKLNLTEGAVSQVLNLTSSNYKLETLVKYARAAGMKVALVAYDDDDPDNKNGPVGPEIFMLAWDGLGKPRDTWAVTENLRSVAATYASPAMPFSYWSLSYTNSTLASGQDPTTAGQGHRYVYIESKEIEKTTHA